jgi:hypothetical protein
MHTGSPQKGPRLSTYLRYLVALGLTIVSLGGAILAINCVVDPLWFFQGNRLAGYNFHYNERYSKINVFLKDPKRYDCIILGSSTGTLMNPKKIAGYTCVNISFSKGNLKEYVDFLRFVNHFTDKLQLVIVALDGYHLIEQPFDKEEAAPAFIRNLGPLPSPIRTYVGLGPFVASVKTILNYTDSGRYYDHEFTAYLLDSAGPYKPKEEGFDRNFRQRFNHAIGHFDTRNLAAIAEMKAIAKDAKFIAYVPPIAAHYIAYLRVENKLDNYLDALYGAAPLFDSLYDFTMPSAVTTNVDNTNDGMHFSRQVNDDIAARIVGGHSDFGIKLQDIGFASYRRMFVDATDTFLTEAGIPKDQHAAWHPEAPKIR